MKSAVLKYLKTSADSLFIGQTISDFPEDVILHENVRQLDICDIDDSILDQLNKEHVSIK